MQEWRIVHGTKGSTLKQLWVRLRSGLWAPTERFISDAQMMPIMGGSPGTVDKQVAANADDAHENAFGTMQLNYITMTDSGFWAGVRFTGISGLSGATIHVATIDVYHHDDKDDYPYDWLYAEDAAAPPPFTTAAYNISNRTRTTAYEAWEHSTRQGIGWASTQANPPPDISTVIQELATNHDPSAIVIIFDHTSGFDHDFQDYNEVAANAAKLHIEYTAGGPTPGYYQLQYTSEPPTPNAWNQLKQETGSGDYKKLFYEGE